MPLFFPLPLFSCSPPRHLLAESMPEIIWAPTLSRHLSQPAEGGSCSQSQPTAAAAAASHKANDNTAEGEFLDPYMRVPCLTAPCSPSPYAVIPYDNEEPYVQIHHELHHGTQYQHLTTVDLTAKHAALSSALQKAEAHLATCQRRVADLARAREQDGASECESEREWVTVSPLSDDHPTRSLPDSILQEIRRARWTKEDARVNVRFLQEEIMVVDEELGMRKVDDGWLEHLENEDGFDESQAWAELV